MKKSIVSMFSRVIAAEMIRHGITPCPEGLSVGSSLTLRLPEDFEAKIGENAWERAFSLLRDETKTEDVLMDVATRFCGSDYLKGRKREAALTYVYWSIVNGAKMLLRSESRRRRHVVLGEGQGLDPYLDEVLSEQPDSATEVEPPADAPIMFRENVKMIFDAVALIHPDAPEYIEKAFEGLPDTEIVPTLPRYAGRDVSHNVWQRYKTRIRECVAKTLE